MIGLQQSGVRSGPETHSASTTAIPFGTGSPASQFLRDEV